MNNHFKIFVLILAVTVSMASCQKTITPSLTNLGPQLVIQGTVSDTVGPYHVDITKTADFYAPNIFPTVSGALVTITDITAGITD